MIPFASQRGGGQDLATHLLNDYDNDLAEVADVRGAIAKDLHGAFREWEIQAETLTKCRKYLYSLSINPDPLQGPLSHDQYLDYIGRTEMALGLADRPRAIVFHVKHGREHCHVVWSRIDSDKEKAVHIAFDREKLMRVTREFARDNALVLPSGYEKSKNTGQISLYEQAQHKLLTTREAAYYAERATLRHSYLETKRKIQCERDRLQPRGLAAFLGRVPLTSLRLLTGRDGVSRPTGIPLYPMLRGRKTVKIEDEPHKKRFMSCLNRQKF